MGARTTGGQIVIRGPRGMGCLAVVEGAIMQ
jgi:hypothetical protein